MGALPNFPSIQALPATREDPVAAFSSQMFRCGSGVLSWSDFTVSSKEWGHGVRCQCLILGAPQLFISGTAGTPEAEASVRPHTDASVALRLLGYRKSGIGSLSVFIFI